MEKMRSFIKSLLRMLANVRREHIGAFAAQSAFFLIMSFIPMFFLVFLMMSFYGIGMEKIYDFINITGNGDACSILSGYEKNTFESAAAIISSVVVAAWSAGKSFKALTEGFHSILHICESRNYLLSRLRGLLYALLFAVVSATMFLVGVFGKNLCVWLSGVQREYPDGISLFQSFDKGFIFVFLFVIIFLLYEFVPDWNSYSKFGRKKIGRKHIVAGALMGDALICIYTVLFAYFIDGYFELSDVYGNLAALIGFMLWLYGTMYILILGFRFCVYGSVRHRKN